MILRILRGALLGTTMLVCATMPAHADPISVAILGYMGYAGAGGLLAPTAVLGSLLFNSFVAALPGFLLTAAIGVGATYLANAMRTQPQQQANDPGSRIVNLRQSIQDRSKSYGRVRTGGPVAFWKLKDGRRYIVVLTNSGVIDAYESYYLNETEVTLDGGTGSVIEDSFTSDGIRMIQVYPFIGATGQTAPVVLTTNFTEWTADHKLTGIAGAVMVCANPKAEDFGKVYPAGREPTLSAVYRATPVFDPRDPAQGLEFPGTYEWSTNAALIIADWLTSPDGLGQEVDWDEVADEADVADIQIYTRASELIAKWQLCGTYYFGQTREEVRKQLAIACDAWFYDRPDGKVGFKLGRWMEPKVTIRPEHIYSIKLGEGQDGETQFNAFSIEYVEPAAGFRQVNSAAVVIPDGQPLNQSSAAAHWVPNHTQASAVAARTLKALRAQYDVTLVLKLYGLLLMPADKDDSRTFRLEYPDLGISGVFELADWELAPDGMSITVTGKSTSYADWQFDGRTDEPEPSAITDIEVSDEIPDPTGVVASSPETGLLYVAFDAPPRPSLLKRVRYRKVGTTDWNEIGVPSSQNYVSINGLPPGDLYEPQAQFRTATAKTSDWVVSTPTSVTISASSSPPDPVTGVSVDVATPGEVTIDWTAPNSPNYVGANIYTNTVNTFPGGTPAATEYGLPNATDSRAVTLAAGTHYAWVRAINSSGNEATAVATGSFIVT